MKEINKFLIQFGISTLHSCIAIMLFPMNPLRYFLVYLSGTLITVAASYFLYRIRVEEGDDDPEYWDIQPDEFCAIILWPLSFPLVALLAIYWCLQESVRAVARSLDKAAEDVFNKRHFSEDEDEFV